MSGDNITFPPAYMLVKLVHDPGIEVALPGLPRTVVPIEPGKFTFGSLSGRHATLRQFPVTLAYAITDYKCQSQTMSRVIVDIKKPRARGSYSPTSAYVQLSRSIARNRVSIMRPFDERDLWEPLPAELIEELKWQEEMADKTEQIYISDNIL